VVANSEDRLTGCGCSGGQSKNCQSEWSSCKHTEKALDYCITFILTV